MNFKIGDRVSAWVENADGCGAGSYIDGVIVGIPIFNQEQWVVLFDDSTYYASFLPRDMKLIVVTREMGKKDHLRHKQREALEQAVSGPRQNERHLGL